MSKESEFYDKLKQSLLETTTFPTQYLYKFIIPTSEEKLKEIENIFNNMGAVMNSKPSSNGKYTSLSIYVNLSTPDEIIDKYKEVGKIEGVISL